MKFIIVFDDAVKNTIELLIRENIDLPLVVAVPAGLLGGLLDGRPIADEELLSRLIKANKAVEIAAHGYYHLSPPRGRGVVSKLWKLSMGFLYFPDHRDYVKRVLYFVGGVLGGRPRSARRSYVLDYDYVREIVLPKRILEERFGIQVVTYIYPNGDCDELSRELVGRHYVFGRTTRPGWNTVDSLCGKERVVLRSYSVSAYTDFIKLEKLYRKLYERVNYRDEVLIVETYHDLVEGRPESLYEVNIAKFNKHMKAVRSIGEVLTFRDILRELRC